MIRKLSLTMMIVLLLGSLAGIALAQDSVGITVRCKASPPEEDWRCNSFAVVEEQVEADLGISIDLTLIQGQCRLGRLQERIRAGVGSR